MVLHIPQTADMTACSFNYRCMTANVTKETRKERR